ncbi:MAG: PAS domain-containing protein, partial [Sedimentisphaerales bacterium]|nr:PAS domain-containing protein [Sedimentisphaerales bacterium]
MERGHLLDCLLDTIQDGIVLLDADHNILLVNKFMEKIVAHKLPVVGKKCYSVFHRRQDPCPECPLLKDEQAEMPRSRVFSHPPEKTPPDWYELRVYELRNDDGVVTGVLEHIREISEQRRADERLNDEITRRRMLVKQSRDGIVVMNADGSVYEANDQYARMLGYSLEEVQKLHVWDWDTEFEQHELLAMIDAIDDAGDHFETRHRRKDGTEFEVEISSNGAVLGGKKYVFCVCRDVSEKKAME